MAPPYVCLPLARREIKQYLSGPKQNRDYSNERCKTKGTTTGYHLENSQRGTRHRRRLGF